MLIIPLQQYSARDILPTLPSDKSILHRLLCFSAIAEGTTTVLLHNDSPLAGDIESSIRALTSLGIKIEHSDKQIRIHGLGLKLSETIANNLPLTIDCGNSGTTARFLMGLLAGQNFETALTGDNSLSRRPMKRLADLLNSHFGARINTSNAGTLPVNVSPSQLHSAKFVKLPVASAQIETALTLAVLQAVEPSTFERTTARDHTRPLLRAFGIRVEEFENENGSWQTIYPAALSSLGRPYVVPLDISAAAFWIVFAAITKTKIVLDNVLLNSSRTGILDVLEMAGVHYSVENKKEQFNETTGTIIVDTTNSEIHPFEMDGSLSVRTIDEIPIVAILAAFAKGTSIIRDIGELRTKESDRVSSVAHILQELGCEVLETADSLCITPGVHSRANEILVDTNDHRIVMAGVLASIGTNIPVTFTHPECVSISYPQFWTDLAPILRMAT